MPNVPRSTGKSSKQQHHKAIAVWTVGGVPWLRFTVKFLAYFKCYNFLPNKLYEMHVNYDGTLGDFSALERLQSTFLQSYAIVHPYTSLDSVHFIL